MEWYFVYPLIILAGFLSGIINSISGSGSLITLPVLMVFGLPATLANGTNRIGILLQAISGSASFKKDKVLDLSSSVLLLIPAILGGILGAFIAVDIDEAMMEKAIGGLLIFMFFVVLWKPSRWLREHQAESKLPKWLQVFIFFLIGVYGGFIQAGVGFFLLGGLVLGSGYNLVKANALKVFITLAFTIVALPVFIYNNQVDWVYGFLLAAGSMAGGWMGAKTAVKKGAGFIRIILLVTIVIASLKLLGLF